jgi:nitroreductase
MTSFVAWLATNPLPGAILLLATGIVLVFLIGFLQGREVSFWPPRISGKLFKLRKNNVSSLGVMDAIRTRKSVRHFLDKPVEQEKLDQILEAARLAPSASNRQEWRFVVVREPETRKLLSGIAGSQAHVWKSAAMIVACAETDGHVMRCGQPCYPIDVAIALDHISLAAVELGLGTCWIGDFDEAKVKQLLDIPDEIRVVELMCLGYPADGGAVEKKRLSVEKVVKYEHW